MKLWTGTILLGLTLVKIESAVAQRPLKLVCYAETWARGRHSPMNYDFSELPAKTCDYLILQFLTLDGETWKLKMHNGYNDVEPDDLKKAANARDESPAMKVLVSVGGWEDGVAKYSDMISEAPRRRAFVESVVDTLDTYNLDGLELHWMYPGVVWRGGRSGDKANFLQLVKELSVAFKPRRWLLTAAVPPTRDQLIKGYNVRRLNSYLHQIHVRTLDMRGDWQGVAENHCPLFSRPNETESLIHQNVNDVMTMWVNKGASKRKLIPTFPLFGRSFTLKNPAQSLPGSLTVGAGKATTYVNAPGIMAYYEICVLVQEDTMKRYFVLNTQTPYAVNGDQWVGYDDEVSLQKKAKFIWNKGFAGAALYSITLDDFQGECGQSHFLLHKTRRYLNAPI